MYLTEKERYILLSFSHELYDKIIEAISQNATELVVFIRFPINRRMRGFLRQHGFEVRLVPERYSDRGVSFEMWREAVVIDCALSAFSQGSSSTQLSS